MILKSIIYYFSLDYRIEPQHDSKTAPNSGKRYLYFTFVKYKSNISN